MVAGGAPAAGVATGVGAAATLVGAAAAAAEGGVDLSAEGGSGGGFREGVREYVATYSSRRSGFGGGESTLEDGVDAGPGGAEPAVGTMTRGAGGDAGSATLMDGAGGSAALAVAGPVALAAGGKMTRPSLGRGAAAMSSSDSSRRVAMRCRGGGTTGGRGALSPSMS